MEGVAPGGIAGDIVGGTEAKQYSASSTSSPSPPPSPPPAFPSVAIAGAHGMAAAPEAAGLATGMMAGASDLFRGKKRGRPRKYGSDGMALALTSPSSGSPFSSDGKQSKGRPPGSGKNQLLAALGEWFAHSAGGNFTPHVVTISAGEDVAARILSFSQKGPQSICILSANGAISNVTLRQPGSSGGTLTYEGRFEILSLSGSFTLTEIGGIRSRTGGISVSLAGPDGRVIGGGIAGTLLAASPIQVVVGSFTPNTFKDPKPKPTPQPPPQALPVTAGPLAAARPISQANPQVDCETPTLTLPVQPEVGNMDNPTLHAASWHGLQSSEHKASPDINICLHGEY
ncbi:AT-hook motif nuclear-localized protein 1-like [Curcuma longa]|uniref:AT-hook motif nuclear-localized protein 1-like n=1 Tax=Curcuma longa TaxID=136217 RepID=UPI003D9EF3EC